MSLFLKGLRLLLVTVHCQNSFSHFSIFVVGDEGPPDHKTWIKIKKKIKKMHAVKRRSERIVSNSLFSNSYSSIGHIAFIAAGNE